MEDSKETSEAADSCQLIHAPDDGKTVTSEQECAITSGSTICVVPYHPFSATRTYFMAVSRGTYLFKCLSVCEVRFILQFDHSFK